MNRFIDNIILAGIFLILISTGTIHASDCFNINGESSDENSNTRPFVCFDHDTHNENASIENCDRCHHLYDEQGNRLEGQSSEEQSCSECHADAGKRDSNQLDITLAAKYHKLCRDCHLVEKKGPVVCGECHRKQR